MALPSLLIAIDEGVSVQEVPYEKLRSQLLADGQLLEAPELTPPTPTRP